MKKSKYGRQILVVVGVLAAAVLVPCITTINQRHNLS